MSIRGSITSVLVALALSTCIGCDHHADRKPSAPDSPIPNQHAGAASKPTIFAATSYTEALKQNATDGKVLIVKATASWCPPCQQMNRETFVDPKVIAWVNAHGTAVELDVDEEPKIAKELKIEAIPTMMIYKGGKQLATNTGFQSADDFIKYADKAIAGK